MKSKFEKRECHRFEIPGAYIRYQRGGLWKVISHLSNIKNLGNISKGGLCFEDDNLLHLGDKLTVYLYLPHGVCWEIKGAVAWRGGDEYSGYSIGVNFVPYKNGYGFNSPEVLDALRSLEAIYLDDRKQFKRAA
jgi:hypothetical protein